MIETTRQNAQRALTRMGARSRNGAEASAEEILQALGDTIPLMQLAVLADAAISGNRASIDDKGAIRILGTPAG